MQPYWTNCLERFCTHVFHEVDLIKTKENKAKKKREIRKERETKFIKITVSGNENILMTKNKQNKIHKIQLVEVWSHF